MELISNWVLVCLTFIFNKHITQNLKNVQLKKKKMQFVKMYKLNNF